jgi:YD repeat-containing protein
VTDVLASVVKDEPRWDALPAETPAAIRTLLRRCLQKERRKRLASAADARIEIEDVLSGGSTPAMRASPAVAARRSPLRSIATAAALLVALAGGYLLGSRWGANPGGPAPVTRFVIGPPAGTQIVTGHRELAISNDGHQIAFIARGASDQHIYVRRIDELTPRQVTGTDGARDLAFSPDGRSLVFHSGNRIRIVSLAGGAPTAIAEAVHSHGLAWHPSEPVIYFSPHQSSAIWKVATDGGSAATQVTTLDSARGEISHEWPILTDDGRRLVFTSNANGGGFDRQTVSVLTLATNDRQTVRTGGNAFALTGQDDLLYVRMGALMRGRYAGDRLDSPVLLEAPSANEHVVMSPTGALAFVPEPDYKRRSLIWIAPDGRTTDAGFGRRAFASIALSPDGRRAAFTISDDREDTLYLGDLSGGLLTPLVTPGPWTPVWSPDGRWIAGTVRQPGRDTLTFSRVATEVGRTWEILTDEIIDDTVTQWTRDGRGLLVSKRDLTSGQRYVVELALGSQPPSLTPVADSGRDRIAQSASLSPDGRWLAYESNESGRLEVYVQAYPTATSRVQVSREGGQWPLWSKGGDVLYFRAGSALLSSAVTTSPALRSDPPRVILRDPLLAELIVSAKPFDVAPDGRVLAIREDDSIRSDHIVVVQNWLTGVQAPNR